MDSELRRHILSAAAYGFAALACACVAFAEWERSNLGAGFYASIFLAVALLIALVLTCAYAVRLGSRAGKVEVTFISVKDGAFRKEPPVVGKRPPR